MSSMLWDKGSLSRPSCCPLGHDGLRLLLQQEVDDLRTLCRLLQTSKAARDAALTHCSVPLLCSPDTLEQAERTAAWIAKYGSSLSSFEWQPKLDRSRHPSLDQDSRAAAFVALAAALRMAEATPRGLSLCSCKLASVNWDCAIILQQLPVNTLTSLELSFDFNSTTNSVTSVQQEKEKLAGVVAALPQLQQLRKLVLEVDGRDYLQHVDSLLQPLSSLTNLTRLEVGPLWSLRELQHAPPGLLELYYDWEVFEAANPCYHPLKLTHLTALTKLTTGLTADIFYGTELPLSLKELQCGRLPDADPLLPLRYLQRLEIQSCMSKAAELQRLSSLTHISICYVDTLSSTPEYYDSTPDDEITPDVASAAWPALTNKLRELHIVDHRAGLPDYHQPYQLSADAVEELGRLTALTSLSLMYMQCPEVTPQQLAAALKRCTALQELELGDLQLQWGAIEGLTGDGGLAAAKARGMQAVAAGIASLPSLQKLSLSRLPVDMHAAAALAAAAGAGTQLTHLSLKDCKLSDCSMNVLALGLTSLKSLEIRYCDVGDASLPALVRLQLQLLQWSGCKFTDAALDLFMPR
ncbi:hypothetical protein OEZ86_009844 [Tetradesmus obliquus]|uniref:Uncharacterized protein n=1 Tax=Tetradesmus obliquus TaxID=3088 RepID=A0ABY8UTN3_TETOB|nr:hypothetical protein OEZ85_001282 [Tetradesmus obliquus]WIA43355.1 hypothetical protein OEZ86_009844 [Tetradesmus obliquus]